MTQQKPGRPGMGAGEAFVEKWLKRSNFPIPGFWAGLNWPLAEPNDGLAHKTIHFGGSKVGGL